MAHERMSVMIQNTLEKNREMGLHIEERSDLGYTDILSPDGTRRLRVLSEDSKGDTIVSLIATSGTTSGTVEFPLMNISRPAAGDTSRTPRLQVPATHNLKIIMSLMGKTVQAAIDMSNLWDMIIFMIL